MPFIGFIILALFGKRISNRGAAAVGCASVGLSAVISMLIAADFISFNPDGRAYSQVLWTWLQVGGFRPQIGLYLDSLSLIMVLVVSFVAFFIHLYSAAYMRGDDGYSRFFAYMNLFVGSMLTLVLADNLLLLYLGWEGVGLCSYLLIGFWYRDPANIRAAVKAFIITRVGDTSMAIGLFFLFLNLGSLNIQQLLGLASRSWPIGSGMAVAGAALLLGGALGKSAQLPLQTWLPDAMAGPTPVSALIHAATMVTAGVYLIARTHVLFELAPQVQAAVAVIGAVTLLVSAASALTQVDIKRVLAYSTISQIGYMFLALGVGAWSGAIFHFMTHAFFKALLFLAAGVIITAMGGEHDIFKMGGLRKTLPLAFWAFLAGAASLAAIPFITAGFYSKDLILWSVFSSTKGGVWLWLTGLAGAFLTALYIFRVFFVVFFGQMKAIPLRKRETLFIIPLVVLAVFSVIAGFVDLPGWMGAERFTGFISTSLPLTQTLPVGGGAEFMVDLLGAVVPLIGLLFAYLIYIRKPAFAANVVRNQAGRALNRFWLAGWGFDAAYDILLVRPFDRLSRMLRGDAIDLVYSGIAWLNRLVHLLLSGTETGRLRWYVLVLGFGGAILIGIAVLL